MVRPDHSKAARFGQIGMAAIRAVSWRRLRLLDKLLTPEKERESVSSDML